MDKIQGDSTRCIHDGVEREKPYNTITTPIIHNAPYTFKDSADLESYMFQRVWGGTTGGRSEYARDGNATILAAEKRLAALEGADEALLFASGMNAFTTLLITTLKSGDHIVLTDDCYRHSREFCETYLKRFGVEMSVVPTGDYAALENVVQSGKTKYIISESPTNPCMFLVDFERMVAIAKNCGAKTLIDSTFASPINHKPVEYGIDFIWHSATKYIGGHHDLLAGVILGSAEDMAMLRAARVVMGGLVSPETAFLIERGIRTLSLRMERHNHNASAVAEFLETQPKIERVWYPGLSSHPDHELAKKQMKGYGGVVSFEVAGGAAAANALMDHLQIPYIAVSLGGVESLIGSMATMAFYDKEPEEREELGIKDNLLRYSIGLEDAEDLIADLDQALAKI